MADFLEEIKKASVASVMALRPVDYLFGKVTSLSPLVIALDDESSLQESQLHLSRLVKNITITETVNYSTENASGGSGQTSFASHSHQITGTKTITLNLGLILGDRVILLKKAGGQHYLVLDKVG